MSAPEPDMERRECLQALYADTELVFCDGMDEAIIGVATRASMDPSVCYNYHRCINILMQSGGCSHEEALEYFECNIIGEWVGNSTPVFLEEELK